MKISQYINSKLIDFHQSSTKTHDIKMNFIFIIIWLCITPILGYPSKLYLSQKRPASQLNTSKISIVEPDSNSDIELFYQFSNNVPSDIPKTQKSPLLKHYLDNPFLQPVLENRSRSENPFLSELLSTSPPLNPQTHENPFLDSFLQSELQLSKNTSERVDNQSVQSVSETPVKQPPRKQNQPPRTQIDFQNVGPVKTVFDNISKQGGQTGQQTVNSGNLQVQPKPEKHNQQPQKVQKRPQPSNPQEIHSTVFNMEPHLHAEEIHHPSIAYHSTSEPQHHSEGAHKVSVAQKTEEIKNQAQTGEKQNVRLVGSNTLISQLQDDLPQKQFQVQLQSQEVQKQPPGSQPVQINVQLHPQKIVKGEKSTVTEPDPENKLYLSPTISETLRNREELRKKIWKPDERVFKTEEFMDETLISRFSQLGIRQKQPEDRTESPLYLSTTNLNAPTDQNIKANKLYLSQSSEVNKNNSFYYSKKGTTPKLPQENALLLSEADFKDVPVRFTPETELFLSKTVDSSKIVFPDENPYETGVVSFTSKIITATESDTSMVISSKEKLETTTPEFPPTGPNIFLDKIKIEIIQNGGSLGADFLQRLLQIVQPIPMGLNMQN